jgi:glucokinase
MLLAADVGATKTLIGIFRANGPRPSAAHTRVYATLDVSDFGQIVQAFLQDVGTVRIDAVCVGVAGPVRGLAAELTNGHWSIDLGQIVARLGNCHAALLNDVEAMAYAVSVLQADEVLDLQAGRSDPDGNAGLIAAGTGLNESHIQRVDGQLVPSPSETGHSDFAARTPRELDFVRDFVSRGRRVDVESVLSGPGLVNLFRFTHRNSPPSAACPASRHAIADRDLAAEVTATALAYDCPRCVETLEMFVSAYGAEAGNLALRSMATAGVYVGGGIAPKILPALLTGRFMEAFRSKGPMTDLMTRIPVRVILDPRAGLVGASVKATRLTRNS